MPLCVIVVCVTVLVCMCECLFINFAVHVFEECFCVSVEMCVSFKCVNESML